MSELKSKLPGKPKQDIDAFILGADAKAKTPDISVTDEPLSNEKTKEKVLSKSKEKSKVVYAWEEPGIRDDVLKVYNLRLPEAYLLKLKYISENTPDSMQKFCLNVIQSAIDDKISELIR